MSTHQAALLWPGEAREIKGTLTKHHMEKAPAAKHSHEATRTFPTSTGFAEDPESLGPRRGSPSSLSVH